MTLDISTLVILTIAVCLSLGASALIFSRLQQGTRGMRSWGAGMVGLGAGYLLLYLHPYMTDLGLAYGGWVLCVASVLLMYRALLRIAGNSSGRTRFNIIILLGATCGWIFFTFVIPSIHGRLDTTSVSISVITARAAWDLWAHARRHRYRAPAVVVAVLLVLVAVSPLAEIPLRAGFPDAQDPILVYGPPDVVFARLLMIVVLSMSVLWLEISRLYEEIEAQAMHDELTGTSSRRAVIAQFQRELARSERNGTSCSIAIFDADHFKQVNDTWGHPVGDEVLKQMTKAISGVIRSYDTLGRYGGEEFLLVMPGTDKAGAFVMADRARRAVHEQPYVANGRPIKLTISGGIATSSEGLTADALLLAADDALYHAKESGRNRVVVDGWKENPAPVAG